MRWRCLSERSVLGPLTGGIREPPDPCTARPSTMHSSECEAVPTRRALGPSRPHAPLTRAGDFHWPVAPVTLSAASWPRPPSVLPPTGRSHRHPTPAAPPSGSGSHAAPEASLGSLSPGGCGRLSPPPLPPGICSPPPAHRQDPRRPHGQTLWSVCPAPPKARAPYTSLAGGAEAGRGAGEGRVVSLSDPIRANVS